MPRGGEHSREPDEASQAALQSSPALYRRRDVVKEGIKLAFVAPLLSTFLARQAYASYSCYPQGHACTNGGGDPENCCPGLTCQDPDVDTNYTCEP